METIAFILICWLLVSIIAGFLLAACIEANKHLSVPTADSEPTPLSDYREARR